MSLISLTCRVLAEAFSRFNSVVRWKCCVDNVYLTLLYATQEKQEVMGQVRGFGVLWYPIVLPRFLKYLPWPYSPLPAKNWCLILSPPSHSCSPFALVAAFPESLELCYIILLMLYIRKHWTVVHFVYPVFSTPGLVLLSKIHLLGRLSSLPKDVSL